MTRRQQEGVIKRGRGRPRIYAGSVDNDGMTPQQARFLRNYAIDNGLSLTRLKMMILTDWLTSKAKMSREEQGLHNGLD